MTPRATPENTPGHERSVVLTIRQASAQYKITQKRILTALDSGELTCYDGAGAKPLRIYRTDLESWLTHDKN